MYRATGCSTALMIQGAKTSKTGEAGWTGDMIISPTVLSCELCQFSQKTAQAANGRCCY